MTTLKRVLTWREGAGFTVAAVLGSGVLILPALTAQMAGPAALVAWALMALAVIPMALTLGRLAILHPDAGGIAAYARAAFGDRVARIVGFLYLGTVPVAGPAAALIGVGYVSTFLHLPASATILGSAILLAIALLTNALGVELSGRTVTLVVVTVAVIMLAAVAVASPHVEGSAFTPFAPHGWAPVGASTALLFWAFIGWEMLGHMAEEFVRPERDLPRALWLAIGVVDVLYLAVALVTVGTHMYGHGRTGDALAQLVGLGLGNAGMGAVTALALLVTYGTIHTYVAGFSRLVYAQARAGDLPRSLARLHPRLRTPTRVLAISALPFTLVLLAQALHPVSLGTLIAWPSAIFIALYVVAMAAGVRLLKAGRQRLGAAAGTILSAAALLFVGVAVLMPLAIAALSLVAARRGPRVRDDEPGSVA